MTYTITNYTYKQAKKLGVTVKPSTNKTKKIDVYKKGKKIASVGALGMGDFPSYIKKKELNMPKNVEDYTRSDMIKIDIIKVLRVGMLTIFYGNTFSFQPSKFTCPCFIFCFKISNSFVT